MTAERKPGGAEGVAVTSPVGKTRLREANGSGIGSIKGKSEMEKRVQILDKHRHFLLLP